MSVVSAPAPRAQLDPERCGTLMVARAHLEWRMSSQGQVLPTAISQLERRSGAAMADRRELEGPPPPEQGRGG